MWTDEQTDGRTDAGSNHTLYPYLCLLLLFSKVELTLQHVVESRTHPSSYKLLFLARMEKIKFEIEEIMRGQHFLHTKAMGVVCCHSNQSSNSICFKT